ncbi:M16 family metallopeptidase [Polyangium sp. 15x6]|uniref:M16 family metallopeptidase n=1 Tax=Polyangium sp. 15x6 TaxID=3042687 RepID=UPI00249CEFB6|nr:M16 family metallopeptidase [Polyangium sp. 15x6]MDI3284270.1 insulinase family protein [Polyangium sp. 15x6]
MNNLLRTGFVSAALALLPACVEQRPSVVPEHVNLYIPPVPMDGVEIMLPSGLRVLVERDTRAPFVGVFTFIGAGASSDPKGKEGLAHFVEHLVYRARPHGKTTLEGLLEQAGAAHRNGMTNLDATAYYEMGPADALPDLLRLAGARMLAPTEGLLPDDIEVELDIVRAELRDRSELGPAGRILGAMQVALFPADHPYARPPIGTLESLASLTLDDVKGFVREHYRPHDTTMVIVGDVALKEVEQAVNTILPRELTAAPASGAPSRAKATKPAVPPAPPPRPAALSRIDAPVSMPELWVGWSLPSALFAGRQQLQLLKRALDEYLHRTFREAHEFGNIGTLLLEGRDASMLLVSVPLRDASDPAASLGRILGEVDQMMAPLPQTVQAAYWEHAFVNEQKKAILGALLDMEHPSEHALEMARSTHFTGTTSWYLRSINDLAGAEPWQIAGLGAKYLGRKRARAVYVVPAKGGAPGPAPASHNDAVGRDDERLPVRVDAEQIRRIARPPGFAGYRQYVLPNGLEVIIGVRSSKPVVTAGLLLRGSARTSASPAEGHVAMQIGQATSEPWTAFGGSLGRRLNVERVEYVLDAATGNTASMLEALAQSVRSMQMPPSDFLLKARAIATDLEHDRANPAKRGDLLFWQGLYGPHPFGRSILPADLRRVESEGAEAWLKQHHAPRNAVLAVVGDVVPSEVEKAIEEVFGDWEDEAPAQKLPALPKIGEARAKQPQIFVTNRPGATRATLHFGCLLPPLQGRSPARYELMAQLVEARLHAVLRRRLGMTYVANGFAATLWGGVAHLSIRADADQGRLGEALVVLRDVLRELEEGKLAPGELDAARLKLARQRVLSHVTNSEIVEAVLDARHTGISLGVVDQYGSALASVTPDDVKEGFRRCAAGSPTLSLVGDEAPTRAAAAGAFP